MVAIAILGAPPAFGKGLPLMRPRVPTTADIAPILEEMRETGYMSNFGPIARRFEEALAEALDVKHCLALANLSTGLMYMPRAAGLGGGEVVVPSFTFAATVHSLVLGGLTPVFADIDPETYCIDPGSVESAIGPNTVAVCGVHVYGTPCDVHRLQALCDRHGLALFYDSAHGLGSHVAGKPVGSFGLAEGFSTSVTKVFTTLGEGGFITTNDDTFAEKIRLSRNWGHPGDYDSRFPSIVSKLPEIAAGVGLIELARLNEYVAIRRRLVARATESLLQIPGISLPVIKKENGSGHKDFAIFIDETEFGLSRDDLSKCLTAEGIQSRPYYAPAVHEMTAYRHIAARVPLRVTERASRQAISLPLFNTMTHDEIDKLCHTIAAIQDAAPAIREELESH